MSLLFALAGIAASLQSAAGCSDAKIVASARVQRVDRSEWPNYPQGPAPDAATVAKRRAAAFAALGFKPLTKGLAVSSNVDVDWPVGNCTVSLVKGGFNGVLEDGRTVWPNGNGTISLGEQVAAPQPEPEHPTLRGARFIASTGIMVGDWRVGLWRFSSDHSILAAYHPGDTDPLLPIMDITKPALGVAYLGAPDATGGNLAILQQLGRNSYRWSVLTWGEQAVRAPISANQHP